VRLTALTLITKAATALLMVSKANEPMISRIISWSSLARSITPENCQNAIHKRTAIQQPAPRQSAIFA
jgi:hypothetical protein